jgi:peptidyl-tRNA hydrolase, PTH1 family
MRLVAGLGNPGKKYEGTRHNVGFEVIERLAAECSAGPPRPKFDGDVWECAIEGEKTLLLAPRTFMNLSGGSVRKTIDFYQIATDNVLIVCDDFNLPLGQLRLRASGTDGGQKGLADVIRNLGTTDVPRLRIGIGPVPQRWNPADFVLGKFTVDEQETIGVQTARAADAVRAWMSDGILAAANKFNGK